MMMRFLALWLFMGVTGLRRRDQYWNGDVFVNASATSTGMSQSTFEKMLYTIRDTGFASYDDGTLMPDGRHTTANAPLKTIRKWVDDIQEHWRAVYVSG
jgi:hypothetical protein